MFLLFIISNNYDRRLILNSEPGELTKPVIIMQINK